MFKIIIATLIVFFVSGCSEYKKNNANDKYLSITRASSADEPVSVFSTFSLVFSSDLDVNTINANTIFLQRIVDANLEEPSYTYTLESSLSLKEDNKTILLTPNLYLDNKANYKLTVTTDVLGVDEKSLKEPYVYSFTSLEDGLNPYKQVNVVDANPNNNSAIPIFTTTDITLGFDENIFPSDSPLFTLRDTNTSSEINGTFEYLNSRVTFIPDNDLIVGHAYDVNITNTPVDMYGNDYNQSSGMDWSFTVGAEYNTSALVDQNVSLDTNSSGYLLSAFFNPNDPDMLYFAVASESKIEFFDMNGSLSLEIAKNSSLELNISSEVTDMQVDILSGNLLIATLADGIFEVSVDANSTNLSVSKSGNTITGIYGITKFANKYYLADPTNGITIYDNNFTFEKSIATNGSALKVCNFGDGNVYIADYENGIIELNTTSFSQVDVNVSNNTIKNVLCQGDLVGVGVVGNLYFYTSPNSWDYIESLNLPNSKGYNFFTEAYISKGSFIVKGNIISKVNVKILSGIVLGSTVIVLDSEGFLDVYLITTGTTNDLVLT